MKPVVDRRETHPQRPLIVILGPTASGKTSLSIRLAKRFHGIIISADSRQVYRGLNLGTGKVTQKEMAGIRHELLDVASPRGQYSVARYVQDIHRVLRTIPVSTPIFLVGGSPFYIDAITKPNSFSPVPPNPALRRRLERLTTPQLLKRFQHRDPARLANIDRANRRRIIRALEIAEQPIHRQTIAIPDWKLLKLGVRISQTKLHRNIDRRVDTRLGQGMLREVQKLHEQGVPWSRLDAFGLEYRWLTKILRRQMSRSQAITKLKSEIKDFAKRQMTWWKRDQEIIWVTNYTAAAREIRNWLV